MTDTQESSSEMLEDLAARCEAASGPDREIDLRIQMAVNPEWYGLKEEAVEFHVKYGGQPKYTASIDAAMTLVPDEHDLQMMQGAGETAEVIVVHHLTAMSDPRTAATLPLALCAAAIRARHTLNLENARG